MKISRPFIHSVLAFAIVMLFVQCNKKNNTTEKSAETPAAQATSISGKLPIAYVNIDSLLQKYNYAKDLNESLLRRAENSRANVNEKGRQLEKEMAEFQRKYQNNAFLSQERPPIQNNSILLWCESITRLLVLWIWDMPVHYHGFCFY